MSANMSVTEFETRDPHFAQRVRDSFAQQGAMHTVGASLMGIAAGRVVIEMEWGAHMTQQNGYVHGGILGVPMDSACGYAAMTLMPRDMGVLSIEYKINFLSPAKGERFRFVGDVIKAGRTITIVECQAFALADSREKLVAKMMCTLMSVPDRGEGAA